MLKINAKRRRSRKQVAEDKENEKKQKLELDERIQQMAAMQ